MNKLSKHPRLVFWLRMVGWFGIGCVTPITVFAIKFGLLNSTPTVDELGNVVTSASASLNGWGIVSCAILGSYTINIVKEITDAYQGYSFAKQCYSGICKTLPLVIVYLMCWFLKGVMSQAMYCLAWVIICRLIAVPLNPLPKWKYEKMGVEDYDDALKYLTNIIKLKKGDS